MANNNWKNIALLKTTGFMAMLLTLATFQSVAQLRVATYRYGLNDRIENIRPAGELIAQALGETLTLASYPSIGELVKAIRDDIVDVAFINVAGYLMLTADSTAHAMEPLVTWRIEGADGAVPENIGAEVEIPPGSVLVSKRLATTQRNQIVTIFERMHWCHPTAFEAAKSGWGEVRNAVSYVAAPTDYHQHIQLKFGKTTDLKRILAVLMDTGV